MQSVEYVKIAIDILVKSFALLADYILNIGEEQPTLAKLYLLKIVLL